MTQTIISSGIKNKIKDIVIGKQNQTVVKWSDGDTTVVKCNNEDDFCPEIGLAMCICKKIYGDNYKSKMHKQIQKFEDQRKAEIERKRELDRQKKLEANKKKEEE